MGGIFIPGNAFSVVGAVIIRPTTIDSRSILAESILGPLLITFCSFSIN